MSLGVTVGVQELTFFGDPHPLLPGPRARAGLIVAGDAPSAVDFAALQLRFAR